MGASQSLGRNAPSEGATASGRGHVGNAFEERGTGMPGGRKVFRSPLLFLLNGKHSSHPRSTPGAPPEHPVLHSCHDDSARWAHGTSRDSAVIRRLPGAPTPDTVFCIITGPWSDHETKDEHAEEFPLWPAAPC
jgi:hypothetical protein